MNEKIRDGKLAFKKSVPMHGGGRILGPPQSRPKQPEPADILRFRYAIASLLIIYIIAIVAFHYLEGWDFLDSAYFATTAITTTGSNYHPVTDSGKIFTIVYLLSGVSVGFYILMRLGKYQSHLVEKRMRHAEKMMRRR